MRICAQAVQEGKMPQACDRCGDETLVTTMSYFNTEVICMNCDKRERRHPGFKTAREAEEKAVRAGDYNFPGVGKPDDL